MKRVCQLVILLCFAVHVKAQKTSLNIPEFKNLNPEDDYPAKSLVATYAGSFDILISLSGYSNWVAFEQKSTALAHKENGWYKINIRSDYIFRDTSTTYISIIKIDNAIGDTLWNVFLTNHLFDMEDERTKRAAACSTYIFDADEHDFKIITAKAYKKIYFYAPSFYEEHCPGDMERKQIFNCFKGFEKYLGK